MLTFEDARSTLLSFAHPLGAERIPIDHADGRVLAEDLVAPAPLPPFDSSAMDGIALDLSSLQGEPPFRLRIVGESRAGHAPVARVGPGEACRIFTGAALPPGADSVIPHEEVRIDTRTVLFDVRPRLGANVRREGEDVAKGAQAIARGQRLWPAHLSLVASMGLSRVLVARRPAVTIVSVGDELREAGRGEGMGTLLESNGVALAALCRRAGANVRLAPILRDDPVEATRVLGDEISRCDLLITVGGVSVGDYDIVRPALASAGVSLDFWKVDIKPGKPVAVGRKGDAVVLLLPGNPAAAYVTFLLFGMPFLRARQGDLLPVPLTVRAPLDVPYVRRGKRTEFLRARLGAKHGHATVLLHKNQSSGALSSLAWSDALALIPSGRERIEAGEMLDVLRLCDA